MGFGFLGGLAIPGGQEFGVEGGDFGGEVVGNEVDILIFPGLGTVVERADDIVIEFVADAPFLVAAVAPLAQVLFGDGGAVEFLLKDFAGIFVVVEPF